LTGVASGTTSPIVLFDGVCSLCNRAVAVIIKRDRRKKFRFASMQSAPGRALLEKFDLPAGRPDYLVLIEGDRCYTKSDAVIRIAARLTPFWRCWSALARFIPRPLRDFKYDLIARTRYHIFGKRPSCPFPTPDTADRFL
jgi:predicted DCC family thiol-disulfide oxidoreductase YuxK